MIQRQILYGWWQTCLRGIFMLLHTRWKRLLLSLSPSLTDPLKLGLFRSITLCQSYTFKQSRFSLKSSFLIFSFLLILLRGRRNSESKERKILSSRKLLIDICLEIQCLQKQNAIVVISIVITKPHVVSFVKGTWFKQGEYSGYIEILSPNLASIGWAYMI